MCYDLRMLVTTPGARTLSAPKAAAPSAVMGWLVGRWQWPAAALFAGLFLLAVAPAVLAAGPLVLVVYLQLPAYLVHQYEEHAGDRFRLYVNRVIGGGREALTPVATFWINALGVWAVDLVALYLAVFLDPALGLIAAYLPVVNAVGHVGPAAARREYNPGLGTALVLFLPLGGYGTGPAAYRFDWAGRRVVFTGPIPITPTRETGPPLMAALAREPGHRDARDRAYVAHGSRAQTLLALRRPADAAADYDRVVELADDARRPSHRAARAVILAQAGRHGPAAAEALDLAPGAAGDTLYNLACALARAAGQAPADPALGPLLGRAAADAYAAAAVRLLGRLRADRYFDGPGRAIHLAVDPDLDSLRARKDFRAFIAAVTGKTPP